MYEFYSLLCTFEIFRSLERFKIQRLLYTLLALTSKTPHFSVDYSAKKQQLFIPTELTSWYFNGEEVCLL